MHYDNLLCRFRKKTRCHVWPIHPFIISIWFSYNVEVVLALNIANIQLAGRNATISQAINQLASFQYVPDLHFVMGNTLLSIRC